MIGNRNREISAENKRDAGLVRQYCRGDTAAMSQLVKYYQAGLFGYILKLTANRHETEEVFQETWMRAIKNISRYRDHCFAAWLFRIARNLAIDRRRARRATASLDSPNENGATLLDVLADAGPSPAARAIDADQRTRLELATQKLPDDQKEVFVLRMDAGRPFKEIAAIQGVSINTALARMQYALEKLKTELADGRDAS